MSNDEKAPSPATPRVALTDADLEKVAGGTDKKEEKKKKDEKKREESPK